MTTTVQTVLGGVDASDLGVVLPHEHVFFDLRARFQTPTGHNCGTGEEPMAMEYLGRLRYGQQQTSRDNLVLDGLETAIGEIESFVVAGGGTVVDLSPASNGRDIENLKKVSESTGAHLVVGTGYYLDEFLTDEVNASRIDELAAVMVRELTEGIDDTGVRAGIIGEVGASWPLTVREEASLIASAVAQQQTGAAISIHPGRHRWSPQAIVEVLRKAGADLSRVVIGHLDRTFDSVGEALTLADSGVYLEFDLFGQESSHIRFTPGVEMPNDMARLRTIAELVRRGYLDRVLVSHDVALKHHLQRYGGHGYAHLQSRVVPRMPEVGLSSDEVDAILRRNPARMLARTA